MSDERLRSLMRPLFVRAGEPPPLDAILSARAKRWRVRPLRAALAAACAVTVVLAVVETRPRPAQQLAELTLPPTTDWLLETPPADWLAHTSTQDPSGETNAP